MWLLLLSPQSFGGSIVLYDGSALVPDPLATLRLVERLEYVMRSDLKLRLCYKDHHFWDICKISVGSDRVRAESKYVATFNYKAVPQHQLGEILTFLTSGLHPLQGPC
jgi:hypothetical protein